MPPTLSELTGPLLGSEAIVPLEADLTKNGIPHGEPKGERILVTGRLLDEAGTPLRDARAHSAAR